MNARCVTFFSYKGGVDRTVAVAEVARELVLRHAARVLMIDWDLEAPALHFQFEGAADQAKERPGLLEYLFKASDEYQRLERDPALAEAPNPARVSDHVVHVHVPGAPRRGRLWLMAAGCMDPTYGKRLTRFDWRDFYEVGGGYWIVERLRLQALTSFDVILIDAPAGRSRGSAVPLLQLPDVVVMTFARGDNTIDGIRTVGRSLATRSPRVAGDRMPAKIVLLPYGSIEDPAASVFEEMVQAGAIDLRIQSSPGQYALGAVRTIGEGEKGTEADDDVFAHLADALIRRATEDEASVAQAPRDPVITAQMTVLAADGVEVGVVDQLDGDDRIKVTGPEASGAAYHFIPLDWVDHVDGDVHLSRSSIDVHTDWNAV